MIINIQMGCSNVVCCSLCGIFSIMLLAYVIGFVSFTVYVGEQYIFYDKYKCIDHCNNPYKYFMYKTSLYGMELCESKKNVMCSNDTNHLSSEICYAFNHENGLFNKLKIYLNTTNLVEYNNDAICYTKLFDQGISVYSFRSHGRTVECYC